MSIHIGPTSSASQVYAQSTKQASAPPPKKEQNQDTVALSKQAQAHLDADHDGDSR